MIDLSQAENQIQCVESFEALVSTPFHGEMNALCWERQLIGDFSEIVEKFELNDNIVELDEEELQALHLSEQGKRAREILLNDMRLLKDYGASPTLNIIKCYDRDDSDSFFPTDVYSFHVDRSPIPTDTFLCTYHGAASDILLNSQAEQKIFVPEIRSELKRLYNGANEAFDSFLSEYFFDLHYRAKSGAQPFSLGVGHLWKLAVDYPESKVLPCVHRAPKENAGQNRLLLIC